MVRRQEQTMKLNEKQLQQVDAQVKRLLKSGSFYGEVYRKAGISGVSSQEDFEKLPFSSKDDLRNAYPLGIQAVPEEEVVRIHSSSGTTGKPVIIPYTAKDVDDWAIMFARCYETAGITNKDRIQITPAYGLWTAGIGFQLGAEKLGAMTVPMGPGNTDKQLQMMMDLKTTVLTATSSYALLLAEEINKRGLRDKIHLKKGVFGSERWSKKMREYIRNELGVELYDIYGLTEIYGPGIGISCQESDAMHVWSDFLYLELIDPKTGELVPDGEPGEIVLTTAVGVVDVQIVPGGGVEAAQQPPRFQQQCGIAIIAQRAKVMGDEQPPRRAHAVAKHCLAFAAEFRIPDRGDLIDQIGVEMDAHAGAHGQPRPHPRRIA